MKKILKHIAIAFVIFLALSGIFTYVTQQGEGPQEIDLNTLAREINEGSVASITVEQQDVTVTLADGTEQITQKERDASLTETLRNLGVAERQLNTVALTVKEPSGLQSVVLNILPFLLPFLLIVLILWFMMRQAQRGNMQALSFGQSRARISNPFAKKRVTFADVAGTEEAKQELGEVVEFLKEPQKFLNIGAQIPRGVLMMGPPGTGKTLLARAVAGEANVPFFYISGSDFVEMFVGVGASRVRDLFETAKKNAPAIVFIDELDAVGRHRGAGLGGGHDEREQTLNQILVEMDGFDRDSNVIVVAATNRPDILDPALLRPGRFDRRVTLDLPDIKDRKAILDIHLKDKKVSDAIDVKKVAQRTPGFSGADLANLINEGAILAARRDKKVVEQEELFEAIERVMLGPERKSHVLTKQERRIAAYHEAGHAIVAARLKHSDPVHKVSIVSRGRAGGFTLKLPSEDRHFRSRAEFLADLAVALSGYAAEEIVFDDITTGASNDLEKVTQMARSLVTRYGMSEKLGPVTYGEQNGHVFLGKEIGETRNYSEAIAATIDREVRDIIGKAHKRAKTILNKEKELLETIARELLDKETLEREEFEEIVGLQKERVDHTADVADDETAPSQRRCTRKKSQTGAIEALTGVGQKTAAALRAHGLGSIEAIAAAPLTTLKTIEGIGAQKAKKLKHEAQKTAQQMAKKGKQVKVQVQTE